MQDIGGGHLDTALLPLFTPIYDQYVSVGKLKLLSISAPQRLDVAKSTPTINESGLVKDFNVGVWNGLFIKSGTPAPIAAKLHAALQAAMQDPAVRNALEATGTVVTRTMPLAETSAFINAELVRYRSYVERLGIKGQ